LPYALSVSSLLQPLAGSYPFGLSTNESRRLAVVERFAAPELTLANAFDPIARLAAHLCETPIAFCTLVERQRIRLIGSYGFRNLRELPNESGFCTSVIAQHVSYAVEQADLDSRTKLHTLVSGPENIRFYVGVQLRSGDQNVGTLCVLDRVARRADAQAVEMLDILAQLAVDRLERFATAA